MKPKRTHLELTSGAYLDIKNPDPADIRLDDIALALSNACRWGGHCEPNFSVAQHACLVADIVSAWGGPWRSVWGGLHHDDHEAYTGDIPTPVKEAMGEAYYALTRPLDRAIGASLGIDPATFHDWIVKRADRWALFVEAQRFKPSQGRHWGGRPLPPDELLTLPEGVTSFDECWSHERARDEYLRRHTAGAYAAAFAAQRRRAVA